MPLSRVFAAFLIAVVAAVAQPPSQGSRNITAGYIHLNSADPDAAIAFWKDVIGTLPSNYESMRGVSTLGVTMLFTRKAPSGPSAGSAIDHLAFKVPDLQPLLDRLAKTPYKSFEPQGTEGTLMVDGPDGVRIELIEDNSMYAPLEFSHIHFHSAQPKEMRSWYLGNFGGRAGTDEKLDSILIPGAPLAFTQADSAAPTAGRAIESLVFEVKDLGDFCKQLIGKGVKLDSTPHAVPELKASYATLTDPGGARIELMEKFPR